MKFFKYFFLFFLVLGCSTKDNLVYWCGDHECKNKKERRLYFESHMIVEMKEVNVKKSKVNKILKSKVTKKTKPKVTKVKKNLKKKVIKAEKVKLKKNKVTKTEKAKIEENLKKNKVDIKKSKNLSSDDLLTLENDFDKVVKIITEKNDDKPYPDINDFPN